MTVNSDSNVSNPSFDEIEIDKQAKQQLVIQTISKNISSSSTHKIFRQFHEAISNGSNISCKILSGGYTNYSYKVAVQDRQDLCLFAKLSFEYAIWNPDKSSHYSLKRTENESEIMDSVSKVVPSCVVKPLGCWDVHQDGQLMKLFVTEWSTADEQFCNQFIDGVVDARIAPKLANTLSALHCIKDFDPEFNVNVKPCMENMLEQIKSGMSGLCLKENPINRTEKYCVDTGKDVIEKVADGIIDNYHQRDCLIHSDSHVFNILVEPKPSIDKLELFGPNGTMVLCDWEMAMAGPMGRDVGLALSFPIACYIAHALNGEVVKSIFEFITTLIDSYMDKMRENGNTEFNEASLYRNIMGWSGFFQFGAFYWIKVQDVFPVKDERSKAYVQDAMGILGLKLMRFSVDNDGIPDSATLNDVKKIFVEMIQQEMSIAFKVFEEERRNSKVKMQQRKSSFLRAADRRISDAMLNFAAAEAFDDLDLVD